MAALVGAIIFNLGTWYLGLPSSSSHALIGGLVGSALALHGWHVLQWPGISKIIIAMILSPILGSMISIVCMKLVRLIELKQRWSNALQLISAALLSLGHGGNDAQKTMGVIAILLFSAHLLGPTFYVPMWIVISCNLVMGLGTLAGGWRIIHTLGQKITKLNPTSGACAQTGSALTLFLANHLGIPISTTHTVTGAIAGVGAEQNWLATNWSVLKNILLAWIFTIPAAAILAALVERLLLLWK
jgi:PiT family inorganic phosphate transporter